MTSMASAMPSSMAHSTPYTGAEVLLIPPTCTLKRGGFSEEVCLAFALHQDPPGTSCSSALFQAATSANRASAGSDFAPVFFMIDAR